MKEGYYTILNGFEYKIEQRPGAEFYLNGPAYSYPYKPSATPKFETVIITDDKAAADDTFSFDEVSGQYTKVIDPKSVGDVRRYSISYFYKGYKVGMLGRRDKSITIYLDYKEKNIALELGFTEHDRTEFIKTVDIAEVEMKQDMNLGDGVCGSLRAER